MFEILQFLNLDQVLRKKEVTFKDVLKVLDVISPGIILNILV